jgi:phage anti-repressor protein
MGPLIFVAVAFVAAKYLDGRRPGNTGDGGRPYNDFQVRVNTTRDIDVSAPTQEGAEALLRQAQARR